MFVFPIRDHIPCTSCFPQGDLPQQEKHLYGGGIPYARDLHPNPHILQTHGHYSHFIKGFTHITRPLYDVLGKEVKIGPVQLPLKAQEVVIILKDEIQSAPVLVFPNFDKPFLLETDASKEGLGAVLSQK